MFVLQRLFLATDLKLENRRKEFPETEKLLHTTISAVYRNYTRQL